MFTSLYLLSLFSSQGTIGRIRLRIRFCMRLRMRFTITAFFTTFVVWWAQVDSNHRPHAYQACALTT